ncbi:MAG: MmgE/PrpD family protein [Pseudomonadota bacterium]
MSLHFADFAADLSYELVPDQVKNLLRRSTLDTMGVAAVAAKTQLSQIVRDFAAAHWCAGPSGLTARPLFDGRSVSAPGAAFAGAFTVDSIDAHDGYTACKGHAGSAVFPAVLAFADGLKSQGRMPTAEEFLVALAVAYEVSYRAGLTLHGTAADYHTSGAWTAVGVAAAGGRLLGLTRDQIRHAAGIAEYHGPRSQMMRCIEYPTMLRDGVGWGAPTGVSATLMAQMGFTGAPAVTAEGTEAAPWWSDLGERWEILNTHYKRYPVCRWAHPAMDAAHDLMKTHGIKPGDVARVRIQTFRYALDLAGHDPKTLDEMTYAIVFPVATMIARGKIALEELTEEALGDPVIRRLCAVTDLVETEHYTKISTRQRWADVTLYLTDGREIQSEPRTPKGDPEDPLSDQEITDKYHLFADPVLGEERSGQIAALSARFDQLAEKDLAQFLDLVLSSQ